MATLIELDDTDPLAQAVIAARKAAYGDSNDNEIELLNDALDLALRRLNVTVRDLTDDEIEGVEG